MGKVNLLRKLIKVLSRSLAIAIILYSGVSLLSGCSTSSIVPQGKYLIKRNKIKIDNRKIDPDEIRPLIKQKSNRRILGIYRFHFYKWANSGKERWIERWLNNAIGEPPVILDTFLTNSSVRQIGLYLDSKGYFNSSVSKDIKYPKKEKGKKVRVFYRIKAATPYKIRNIDIAADDPRIEKYILDAGGYRLIQPGMNYDADLIYRERERLTRVLRNQGYYFFTRDYVSFAVDSALSSHQLDILIQIKNPVRKIEGTDSLVTDNHKRYKINNVYVFPQYYPLMSDTLSFDTTKITIVNRKSSQSNDYYFIHHSKMKINPKTITQSIFISNDKYFELDNVDLTYNQLSNLQNFKFININFNVPADSLTDTNNQNVLDCKIQLTKVPSQAFEGGTEVTNSAGNLGLAGNIGYLHKNIFHGAEIFNLRLRGALEVQKVLGEKSQQDLPFNTFETGVDLSIEVPKFLFPTRQERFSKFFRAKTTFNGGLDYQKRPDYTRYITNAAFGYEWKESEYMKHIVYPLEVNFVKINPDSSFAEMINALNDPNLRNSYSDHLIAGLRYSFIFKDQDIKKLRDFVFIRVNFESAGNLLNVIHNVSGTPKTDEGFNTLFNIRYAQYIRSDADFRYYYIINKNNDLVYRLSAGIGVPYGNLNVLPFEKSFWGGGSNSIRAWKLRTIGPGSLPDSVSADIEKIGDISIEGNIEYRFAIYKMFEGAVFMDFGNIWLRAPNEQFPGGEFKFDKFYKDIAFGGGLGLRLNFSYFIFRLDGGLKLKDPSKPEGQRWTNGKIRFKDITWNIGIGYPF